MPTKSKEETVEDKTEAPPAKKTSKKKKPSVSPNQGATGDTTSSESKEAGTQTGLSEEEKDAHYKEEYSDAECELLKNIHRRNPELGWDIIIGTLFKHLARENRAKRSKEEVFSELDNLEALRIEHLGTSGCVPNWLEKDLEHAQGYVEFDNYVTLLKEVRAHFGYEIECIVITYIEKHKGEHYCMNCMSRSDKEK